jgi:dipeptidyl-peptidase 4
LFDVYSSANVPKQSIIRHTDGKWSKLLMESPNPLDAYNRPEVKNVTLHAEDGTPLYGKLILPTNFDASKKYPVIVYLYNGPNVQLLHNSFPESGNLWYEYMAQRGYVVFTMDGRGSSNRGLEFEQATFGKLGTVELLDQIRGVEYLKSLRFVDANRMGIHGWSFGGFMTTSMMLRYPDFFKVGVAGGPVMDWSMYEIMYTERYMNTPQDNPKGYEESNLLTKTKNLKGKLLLIHGADDDVVVWQHSINFVKKCVDNNIPVDYFMYPGHPHNVRGKDRVHLMQKITDYFDLYLKP